MNKFLSCDWGTSSLRLRLVDVNSFKVIAEEASQEGISSTFALWQLNNQPEEKRIDFYLEVLKTHIASIEIKTGYSLNGIPVIISGMASSTIGFIDIAYTELPVNVQDANILTATIPSHDYFNHDVLVISGIRSDDDVIRGEETQLIGCIDLKADKINDELFLFPGTHSKHIHVQNNQMVDIKTYMTGEFFELLSQKSILKNSVEAGDDPSSPTYMANFEKGIAEGINSNLLNAAFRVRTNNLFGKLSKKENFAYLSGMLIAAELKHLPGIGLKKINLICNDKLSSLYQYTLTQLGLSAIVENLNSGKADEAVIRGQYKIYKRSSL